MLDADISPSDTPEYPNKTILPGADQPPYLGLGDDIGKFGGNGLVVAVRREG